MRRAGGREGIHRVQACTHSPHVLRGAAFLPQLNIAHTAQRITVQRSVRNAHVHLVRALPFCRRWSCSPASARTCC